MRWPGKSNLFRAVYSLGLPHGDSCTVQGRPEPAQAWLLGWKQAEAWLNRLSMYLPKAGCDLSSTCPDSSTAQMSWGLAV